MIRPYLWPLWAVLIPFCAPKTPPPKSEKAWANVDAPEPYPSPLPPASGAPSALVSAEEIERLEDAIDAFSQKALRLRQSVKRAGPMSRAQLENWNQLLGAIDRFLESGISSQDSAELIRTRATIEFDLEADAQVYTHPHASPLFAALRRSSTGDHGGAYPSTSRTSPRRPRSRSATDSSSSLWRFPAPSRCPRHRGTPLERAVILP